MAGTRNKDFQIPIFNLGPCHQGRLSMICRLELKFRGSYDYTETTFGIKSPTMQDWERLLLKKTDVNKFEDIHFSGLEMLLLDFGVWKLNEDDKLVVRQPWILLPYDY